MKNLAILQARTSSTRLPGKVLMDLMGEPMIIRQIERIQRSSLIDQLVVATSNDESDNELVRTLVANGVEVRRGSLNNVLSRFIDITTEFKPQNIIRLTADCPLTDWLVIDDVIRSHYEEDADYTSNSLVLSYPDGLDVECIKASTLLSFMGEPTTELEREHVTYGIYTRPNLYKLNAFTQEENLSNLRWTVDVEEDLSFIRWVYSQLYPEKPNFTSADILRLLALYPEVNRTDELVKRNSGMKK